MLRLAREIQRHILSMPDAVCPSAITERALRPMAQREQPRAQLAAFGQLIARP